MSYDENNVFAKILRGEIPCNKVFETTHTLAFYDIAPQRKIHIMVIPKGAYTDMADFNLNACDDELVDFYRTLQKIAAQENMIEAGFRAIANTGAFGGQEVPHFHMHLLGGEPVGKLLEDR